MPLIGDVAVDWPAMILAAAATSERHPVPDVRCALVTESLDASGMDEFVAFLARRLPEEGIEARVLLAKESPGWREGRLADQLLAEGIEVVSATATDGRTLIAEWAPDVLYSHGAAEWPLIAARDFGIPAIEAMHGLHNVFDRTPDQLANRRCLLHKLVAVSELVRLQYMARDIQAPAADVVTIPNGINRARSLVMPHLIARELLGLDDEYLFVSLARHAVQKNTYGLSRAFLDAAAGIPSAHLLICGRPDDPGYARRVLDLRDQSTLGSRLHLRDHTNRLDILLSAADAFVLDSFFEGWSLASMEALGAGLPVLLSDVGGAREQLTGGPKKGRLVQNPLGDPLKADWGAISAARFARQVNHEEVVTALTDFARGRIEISTRDAIRGDSLHRYSDDTCLRSHAAIIRGASGVAL